MHFISPFILAAIVVLQAQAAAADTDLEQLWADRFMTETTELVRIKTYRGGALDERQVLANLGAIKTRLLQWTDEFNQTLQHNRIQPFEWKKTIAGQDYWLFGLRLGSGNYKAAMITHLDTVPPGAADWQPFEPRIESREYLGETQDFLVGRGTIDDKGPAISALIVLRSLAKQYDGSEALNKATIELIFDTAEETDMATPHYLQDVGAEAPDFGIVFDAFWCVRAEKGIERPVFTIARGEPHEGGTLWIESLASAPGPTNQIPDYAEAVIKASDPDILQRFYSTVAERYREHVFDDPDYRRAELDPPQLQNGAVRLITHVAGAQHGSAPQENRAQGANPLVSLANFLADLVAQGQLDNNAMAAMATFIHWTWGTQVFGENHPELLQAHDEVFEQGNGTTYAVTKLVAAEESVELSIDIRYALAHHSTRWDGKTEGLLPGPSRFKDIFTALIADFNQQHSAYPVSFNSATAFGPDVRLPSNAQFSRVNQAYKTVMGEDCPFMGIGGGTDAKGHPELLAVGSLFAPELGPPINFHGINEGAPLEHLKRSTQILYHAVKNEIEHANEN